MSNQLTFFTQQQPQPKLTLPPAQRPAARIREAGPTYLSDTEILAAIARTSDLTTPLALIHQFDGLTGLARADLQQLTAVPGIGDSIAAAIVAAFELGRRLARAEYLTTDAINTPEDVASILVPMLRDKTREHFVVVVLNTRNRVIKVHTLYQGTVDTSVVRIAEVYNLAITHNAPQIMVAHNHPSGDPNPSPEDIALTRRIVRAGKFLDITLLDHLIVGGNRFVSLRRKDLGFEEALTSPSTLAFKETTRAADTGAGLEGLVPMYEASSNPKGASNV